MTQPIEYKPKIVNSKEELGGFQVQHMVDDYHEQLKELFQVNNPSLVFSPDFEKQFAAFAQGKEETGKWVYYPWMFTAVHVLDDADFQKVRTARNRNLINEEEQEKYYGATVGVAGLSVGNSVALAIVLQGGARHIKIADHDVLALSNINRIRVGIQNLGIPKTIMTAREIYEMNPYAMVDIFSDGLTQENMDEFFEGLDIIVDEIDNLAVKYLIRQQAKKRNIPVVMAADNADSGVVDIERYDLQPQPEFFHGRMGEVTYDVLKNLDKFGTGRMIAKHVGVENVTEAMQNSLTQMGKTVVSWPQLGGAALLNGSAVAYCVRKIVNGQSLESNRTIISLDEKLIPEYNSPEEMAKRAAITENFKKIFKL